MLDSNNFRRNDLGPKNFRPNDLGPNAHQTTGYRNPTSDMGWGPSQGLDPRVESSDSRIYSSDPRVGNSNLNDSSREVEEVERDGGCQEQPSGEEVGNDNDESEEHQEQHPTENTRKRDRKYDDKRPQE